MVSIFCFASLFDQPERSPPSSFLARFSIMEPLKMIIECLLVYWISVETYGDLFSPKGSFHFSAVSGFIFFGVVDIPIEVAFLGFLSVLASFSITVTND